MNLKFYFTAVFIGLNCLSVLSQIRIDTIKILTNDIAYDAKSDKIYVTIPSSNGANGNSIGIVNPRTNKLEKTVFMGSEPSVIALSDGGEYAYTGFLNAPAVRRFDIGTQTAGLQINLGNSTLNGAIYVRDIKVLPKKPNSIAVARKILNISPSFQGIAIYDDAVLRPTTTAVRTGANKIQFLNDSILYGYVNELTSFELTRYIVKSTGIEALSTVNNVPGNGQFFLSFIINNQKAYFSNGAVVDVSNTPTLIGGFTNSAGQIVYDSFRNLIVFASFDMNGRVFLRRFNPQNFALQDEILAINAFPRTSVGVGRLVTCGKDCYAFNFSDDFTNLNHIVIVRTNITGIRAVKADNKVVIYPNPASEFIEIQLDTNEKWNKFVIINSFGSIIQSGNWDDSINGHKINISTLNKGIYCLQVFNAENKMAVNKFIKD